MAKKTAKRSTTKKKAVRSKKANARKKTATPRKKKTAVARKKKPAAKKPARKKVAKKKAAKKKPAKKAAKRGVAAEFSAVQKRLEKRVAILTEQLDEMRDFVKKELAQDLKNTRKYADAEMEVQKRRFDQVVEKIKQENRELRTRMSNFVAEHEVLKDVTKGVSDTAKSLEERVRKIVSGS